MKSKVAFQIKHQREAWQCGYDKVHRLDMRSSTTAEGPSMTDAAMVEFDHTQFHQWRLIWVTT